MRIPGGCPPRTLAGKLENACANGGSFRLIGAWCLRLPCELAGHSRSNVAAFPSPRLLFLSSWSQMPPVIFSTPGQLRRFVPRAIIRGMKPTNPLLAISALLIAMVFPLGVRAQTTTPPPSCTASSDAAVQCFVANAVTTGLTTPRYGMTLAQFQDYGVAVTKILQTDQTYLVLVGLSSAIADALPPKNADGTFDSTAQDTAIAQIVAAAATDGFIWPPSGTTLQDLQWFTQDLVN